jgi:hypothetical protein
MWHTGHGWVKYDPPRPGLKKKINWWAILTVDREITRYYRWWVKRHLHVDLKQPSWDAHISIIRGEKPSEDKMQLWKKYDGRKINFEYKHHVRQSGDTTEGDRPSHYWFIEVRAPKLLVIREEFGFPTNWKLHLTIGRTW